MKMPKAPWEIFLALNQVKAKFLTFRWANLGVLDLACKLIWMIKDKLARKR